MGAHHSPLLHGKRLVFWHAEADHLSLSIEAIQVNVGDHPEWTGSTV
jgi:hypothetical protein